MEILQAEGVDINLKSFKGNTPINAAAANDAVNAMEWLEKQGIFKIFQPPVRRSVCSIPSDSVEWVSLKRNAISISLFSKADVLIKWLKTQGADINADNELIATVIFFCSIMTKDLCIGHNSRYSIQIFFYQSV